ncbi:DUF5681 domain-containing protein [Solidesulfovibrio sp.]
MPDKTQEKQKRLPSTAWKKGQSGNPKGCPTGSRHKATVAAQALLDGESEALTRKAVELALDGDMTALRLCLERIVPPRKDAPILVDLPPMQSAADIPQAMGAILASAAAGELTPSEAAALAGLVETHRRALETSELEQRITALEQTKGA